jgi:hypothetical protein
MRRLQLIVDEAGIPVLLFGRWRKPSVDPLSAPSAAAKRWGRLPTVAVSSGTPYSVRRGRYL